MTRSAAILLAILCVALALVVAGADRLIRRDRAELVERFGAERQRVIIEAAREIGRDIDQVAGALRFAAVAIVGEATSGDAERELRALRAAVPQYRSLRVYGADGALRYAVGPPLDADGARPDEVRAAEVAIADAIRQARGRLDGQVRVAPVMAASGRGWSRVLALGFARRPDGPVEGIVAALIDMSGVFDQLHLLSSDGSRVLLIGGPGEPTSASDPALANAISLSDDARVKAPQFAEMLRRMRAGESGVLVVDEAESARLGLGAAQAIGAFSVLGGTGLGRWSVASLSTTSSVRALERSLVLRLGGAALVVALLLVTFGAYFVVASRRQVAMREHLRHADELRRLHERTEKILENIPTGVMTIGDDGRVAAVNRALREKLPEDAVGQRLGHALPEAPAAVVARLESLVSGAREAGRVRTLPGERLALFGEEGQYILHAVPLEPRADESRVVLVVEDVSEVRQLASQLLRAEKLASIGVLAAGIAHEMGTPLGVVRGRAEYILGKLGPGHAQAPGLEVIVEQIDRVSRTIRQLLDFARVRPAQVRPVPLAPIARAVVELLRYEAERRRVDLAAELPDVLPTLMADPDQLQQVIVNLAMNALDACEAGGHVRLRAGAESPPGDEGVGWRRVRIVVEDDGCGIPVELRHQIFDPFFTTKKRGQGTGLGLTMAADIARSHGAEIEVESEPGRGTRMVVLWPTDVAGAPAEAPPERGPGEARKEGEVHGAA